jgi:hypothetical protein
MSPDSLMEIVNGRSMKQETLDAAPRIENPCPYQCGEYVNAVTLSYQQVAGQVAFHESVAFVDIMRADTDEPVPMDPIVAHNLSIVKTVEARREASRASKSVSTTKPGAFCSWLPIRPNSWAFLKMPKSFATMPCRSKATR